MFAEKIAEYVNSKKVYVTHREVATKIGISLSTVKRERAKRRVDKQWDLNHWKRITASKERAFLTKSAEMLEGWKIGICRSRPDAIAVIDDKLIVVKAYGWNRRVSEEKIAKQYIGFDKIFVGVGEADRNDALATAIDEMVKQGARVVRVHRKPYGVAYKDKKCMAIEVVKVKNHKLTGGMTYTKLKQMHEEFDGVVFIKTY